MTDPTRPPATDAPLPSLTTRQRRFVEEYAVDGSATQAAIRAGYSPDSARSIGHENLTKPDIRRAIDAREAERAAVVGATADYVVAALVANHERASAAGRFADSIRALELLGRRLGLWAERPEADATRAADMVERMERARVRVIKARGSAANPMTDDVA